MLTVGILVCPGCDGAPAIVVEEISPRSRFVVGEAVGRSLLVVYADYSRFEHHGVAARGVATVLTGEFEIACGGSQSSNV